MIFIYKYALEFHCLEKYTGLIGRKQYTGPVAGTLATAINYT